MRAWISAIFAALMIAACTSDPPMQGPTDMGVEPPEEDAGVVEPPDAGEMPMRVECTCDAAEDCRACYEHLGTCCYEDATWFGKVDFLIANCEKDPACAACCNECLAKTCEQLIASNDCPFD